MNGGYQCGRCGTWVWSNTAHDCGNYYPVPSPPQPSVYPMYIYSNGNDILELKGRVDILTEKIDRILEILDKQKQKSLDK